MRFLSMDSLDRWLEDELRNADAVSGPTVPAPRYASLEPPRPRRGVTRLIAGLGATKAALAASAVVALAAGGIVTGKAVTTGDPNPFHNWGSTVTQQVQDCKANPSQHDHGIGQCVSSTAKTHGDSLSDQHSHAQNGASHPTGPPAVLPTGNAAPNAEQPGVGSGHPTGPPSGATPTPRPTPTPTPTATAPGRAGTVHPVGSPPVVPPPHT